MPKKDLSLCRDCQDKPIEYTHGVSGALMKHGLCSDCHERLIRRGASTAGHRGSGRGRTGEQKEAIHETKYGCDR